ncbi:DUF6442 family protein [Allocoprobacillus halotolerans]|uniref:DUF6442 family protein n=1 Tax=Allocoprobacillus halotolerans TaxID=2944914 RepID=A0ABY5I2K3_9FIRM|nr:DUF6442 family protein [Allocoprobacillus halotolerans]UTY39546.1 DUF6442 family protein [Allocoprobacillus halotolerans]
MNKEKVLAFYRYEKDERLLQLHGKALRSGFTAFIILSISLIFFSLELQNIPTIFYTIYILIMPTIIITYGVKAYIEKSKLSLFISLLWLLIIIINGWRYISVLLG